MVRAVLDVLAVHYVTSARIDRFIVDIYVPSRMLVIECDGAYWHTRPGMPERDILKTNRLITLGYTVLRLPEAQILSGQAANNLRDLLGVAS